MKTEHRSDRSTVTFLLHTVLRPLRPLLVKSRFRAPDHSIKCSPSSNAKRHCEIAERKIAGIYIYDISVKVSSPKCEKSANVKCKRIYYFAGGGWSMPPSGQHWSLCTEMTRRIPNTTVSLVSYPLAPANTAKSSLPALQDLYAQVVSDARHSDETIIFAGDSSGGNLALCLTLAGLRKDLKLAPAAVLAICPTVDLTPLESITIHTQIEKLDPILTLDVHNDLVRAWTEGMQTNDADVSPLFADLNLLVKANVQILGVTAGYDILTHDALMFRDKCAAIGVQGEWLQWDKQMHVFPLTFSYRLPESVQAKDWILDVLRRL